MPPSPRSASSAAGQATLEYAGLLALVSAALAAAGAAAGLGGVGDAVAGGIRTGLCLVAGDVCRASDAEAAGLSPCTTADHRRGGGAAITVVSLRFGEQAEWTVASRSDGTVTVTRTRGRSAGVTGGLGITASALGIVAAAEGEYRLTVADGDTWELPNAAAAARLLAADEADRPPPTWRSGEVGSDLAASLAASAAGLGAAGVAATATAAAGARWGRGGTTLYVHVHAPPPSVDAEVSDTPGDDDTATPNRPETAAAGRAAGTESSRGDRARRAAGTESSRGDGARRAAGTESPGGNGAPELAVSEVAPGVAGNVMLELTRDGGGWREIAFRSVEPSAAPGHVVETVGRLDLRDPANRAAAAPLLDHPLPWPPSVAAALQAIVRRTAVAGTVERAVYAVHDESRSFEATARLGLALGVEAHRTRVERRLVAASAWTAGSGERRREDCLGPPPSP